MPSTVMRQSDEASHETQNAENSKCFNILWSLSFMYDEYELYEVGATTYGTP